MPDEKVTYNVHRILSMLKAGLKLKEKRKRAREEAEREERAFRPELPRPPKEREGGRREEAISGTLEESSMYEGTEEGVELPESRWRGKPKEKGEAAEKEITEVDEYYSLVPRNPGPKDDIYAYTHITWDEVKDSLIYKIVEPTLSGVDKKLVETIKEDLEERLDVDFEKVGKIKARDYLSQKIDETLKWLGKELRGERKKAIKYYLERDFIDFGKIEPLMRDPNIEDISCDGVGIPIYIWHRNPKYGSMETDIKFEDSDELDSFVMKLAQKSGKSISMAKPLVDAALPDGSRLQATLGTDIARKGSNFTIRKFTEKPLTPIDLIEFGTIDPRTLAYLWLAIEHQNSVLVSGGTATGKTTMLNVISLFIKPEMKIVTIEDTAELRLPHEHWVPEVAREAISERGTGEVDLYKLLKESLRQRPDYIVVGEVRGEEAFVLFQQMSTGHPGLSTIHAENSERLLDRLTTKPIDLPGSLLEALDIILFLGKVRRDGSLLRKTTQVLEMKRYDRQEEIPKVSQVFKWNPKKDVIEVSNLSLILKKISREKGMDEEELQEDLKDRMRVIEWMVEHSVRDLRTISQLINKYYTDKERLMEKIEATR